MQCLHTSRMGRPRPCLVSIPSKCTRPGMLQNIKSSRHANGGLHYHTRTLVAVPEECRCHGQYTSCAAMNLVVAHTVKCGCSTVSQQSLPYGLANNALANNVPLAHTSPSTRLAAAAPAKRSKGLAVLLRSYCICRRHKGHVEKEMAGAATCRHPAQMWRCLAKHPGAPMNTITSQMHAFGTGQVK